MFKQLLKTTLVFSVILSVTDVYAEHVEWYDQNSQSVCVDPMANDKLNDQIIVSIFPDTETGAYLGIGSRDNGEYLTFLTPIIDGTFNYSNWQTLEHDQAYYSFGFQTSVTNSERSGLEGYFFFTTEWDVANGKSTICIQPIINGQVKPIESIYNYESGSVVYNTEMRYSVEYPRIWKTVVVPSKPNPKSEDIEDYYGTLLSTFGELAALGTELLVGFYMAGTSALVSIPPALLWWLDGQGVGYIDTESGTTVYSASPSHIWTELTITPEMRGLSFDVMGEFLDNNDLITVFIGKDRVFTLPGSEINSGEWQNSGYLDISSYSNTAQTFTLSILSEQAGRQASFKNLKFYRSQKSFPWNMFVPLFSTQR